MAKMMTRAKLVRHLSKKSAVSKMRVAGILDELFNVAVKESRTKGTFIIPGFGKFRVVARKARMGRNPITGAQLRIPAKAMDRFRLAKPVRNAMVSGQSRHNRKSDSNDGLKALAEIYTRL